MARHAHRVLAWVAACWRRYVMMWNVGFGSMDCKTPLAALVTTNIV